MSRASQTAPGPTVVVFSSDPAVRERVRLAVGRTPAADLGRITWLEADSAETVVAAVDAHSVDLCVLDAESRPTGGMGVCRQLKNELAECPPMLLLVARRDDQWLATWSQADAVQTHPTDPATLTAAVVGLLRSSGYVLPTVEPQAAPVLGGAAH